MRTSEKIKEIGIAVIAFEAEMEAVHKGAENPFFKSKYADLPSILQAIKQPLEKHGLGIVQGVAEGNNQSVIVIKTRLIHASGEWIETDTPVYLAKFDPQSTGGAITYGRRYSIQALLNLSAEDDDANSISPQVPPQTQQAPVNNNDFGI